MTSPDSPSLSPEKPRLTQASSWTCTGCGATAKFDERGWLKCPCNCSTGGTFKHPAVPALSEGEPTRHEYSFCRCIKCGHFSTEPSKPCIVSPSLSTSSPPEIDEKIDEFEQALVDYEKSEWPEDAETEEEDAAINRIAAARSAVELSFATLKEEIKRLKKQTETDLYVMGEIIAARDSIVADQRALLSENERLRATALTPEEAKYLLPLMDGTLDPVFVDQHLYDPLAAKLRKLRRALSGETPK